ncbi:MAG: hypothetical protein JNL96_23465 [Planctomycetaceae bacterium]|nr:hypothetical protein [Planctomycetaceae bacterium]
MQNGAAQGLTRETTPMVFGAEGDSLGGPFPPLSSTRVLRSACLLAALLTSTGVAAPLPVFPDLDSAWTGYRQGRYEEALAAAEQATANRYAEPAWWRLRLQALATLGKYRPGLEALKQAQRYHNADAALRVIGYDIQRQLGNLEDGKRSLDELLRTVAAAPWRYSSPDDRIWIGRAAERLGADAREVLEGYYDQAQKVDPDLREGYLAVGELALRKADLTVAAESFRKGVERHPDDPDLLYGLSRALAEDEEKESAALLARTLELNPRHLPSLFAKAEEALSLEDYPAAAATLDEISQINPNEPRTWALRAVLANLQADDFAEWFCRESALNLWANNPEVDHLIGKKLSQAYRFSEGAAHQKAALKIDPDYLPAKTQLAQDLLRLGDDAEGWRLVAEAQEADPYDVVLYNLSTLKDRLNAYVTLTSPHFRVHMERREAAVYGTRVVALLERACETLGKKYGWMPPQPVAVEILTHQQDFAIRTFGLPGGDGILGVCFGMVITANSPAALPGRTNSWEATLWHEYCHVVTLEQTRHRIPRWLSEGISVYEERQADRAWGDRLDRDLRQMVLGGELTPVSRLNEAFRNPKSGEHFNLAYYAASLVVEFLVEKHGRATLQKLLADVAAGLPINEALELRVGPLAGIDAAFDAYARAKAAAYGPKVDWTDDENPPPRGVLASKIAEWLKNRPQHYLGRSLYAQALIKEERWEEAKRAAQSLVDDAPQWVGDDSPYTLLAKIHRELGDAPAERQVLEASAAASSDAVATYRRLIDLAAEAGDLAAVVKNVDRYIAVQPLDESPYRKLAELSVAKPEAAAGIRTKAVAAARALVALEPDDRAGAHFLLAQTLHAAGDVEAKRHALLALEETPRFRAGQSLLLAIVAAERKAAAQPSAPRPPTRVQP